MGYSAKQILIGHRVTTLDFDWSESKEKRLETGTSQYPPSNKKMIDKHLECDCLRSSKIIINSRIILIF
jgi:hypothetical protein